MKEKDLNRNLVKKRLEERYLSFVENRGVPGELISEIENYEFYLIHHKKDRNKALMLALKIGAIAASITLILISINLFYYSGVRSDKFISECDIEKFSITDYTNCGSYYTIAIADGTNSSSESNELNNIVTLELDVNNNKPVIYERTLNDIPKIEQRAIRPITLRPNLTLPILEKELSYTSNDHDFYVESDAIDQIFSDEMEASNHFHKAGSAMLIDTGGHIFSAQKFHANISNPEQIDSELVINSYDSIPDAFGWDKGDIYYSEGHVGLGVYNESHGELEVGHSESKDFLNSPGNGSLIYKPYDSTIRYYYGFPKLGRRVLGKLVYTFSSEGPSDFDGDGPQDSKDEYLNFPETLKGYPNMVFVPFGYATENYISQNPSSIYVEKSILTEEVNVALSGINLWLVDESKSIPSIENVNGIQSDFSFYGTPSSYSIDESGYMISEMNVNLIKQINWLLSYVSELEDENIRLQDSILLLKRNQEIK